MRIKLSKHIPTSLDYKFMPNINTILHYVGKTGDLLGITMEAKNDLLTLDQLLCEWVGLVNVTKTEKRR